MGRRIKKIKKIRLHHEGNHTLLLAFVLFALLFAACRVWLYPVSVAAFYVVVAVAAVVMGVLINFFRCPIRTFEGEPEGIVVAPADGRVVVIEEVEENEYFHDRRLMVSIFMSLTNVHANWFPVEGIVKKVEHQDGNFHKAWLPKASIENERSTVVIETPDGQEVLVRQVAGAMARRIVTYAEEGDHCFIDEHMGFIKFGSRVDTFLPLGTELCVNFGDKTTGNETVLARLKA
ncbi:MAG: phosphatidylserine decarboxylase family protein [Bacteroidaceae bacterium]|nr:phosphatidylserine decarboxylase family protein [Bacteroidaceae bacterium]